MRRPPTPVQWRVDGEMRGGHSVAETLAWASWSQDFADEQEARVRAAPFGAVPAAAEPRGWLRRWLGR